MRIFLLWLLTVTVSLAQQQPSAAIEQQQALRKELETVYQTWRSSMVIKDAKAWSNITAAHRQSIVRNRLNSERRPFPQAVFQVPAAPPALTGLRAVQIQQKGFTAKCIYFGKIDFAVGGEPTDNLIIIDYVMENQVWKYDIAEFVSLVALPDVRAELAKGDLSYIEKTSAFRPTGIVPPVQALVPLAKYIGKVYVFCPGRSVKVTVNGISRHTFGNAKEAEIITGGLRDGANAISYEAKDLPGATGNEALSIRVYALSQINGVMPVKLYEYQVEEGKKPQASGSHGFNLDAAVAHKISGR
jgi:hypothetical protein